MALRMVVPLSTCPRMRMPKVWAGCGAIVAIAGGRAGSWRCGCQLRDCSRTSLRWGARGGALNHGNDVVWARSSRSLSVVASSATGPASQTVPNEKLDEETKFWEQIRAHQKAAARLSKVDEARTLVATSSTATLSTISQKYDGFPLGSMVLYATDDSGRPILAISSLSPHTKDLETNSKCSLLIARDAGDISDTVVTIIGEAETVSDAEWESVRSSYLKKHPDAFWVDFGDFRLVRITPKKIRFLAGSATAFVTFGEIDGEEYLAGAVDPIAQFTAPIAGHMNRDHADQTKAIAENSLGVKIDYAKMLQVDRLGFNIEAGHDGKPVKLRIPFPRPAQDRKDVKNLIVELLQGAAP
ncbi:hypothetical protein KC19_4G009600 [Ceratodon purpureus]|uniref:DUF2470 domain-containing protein n=1 Tax=Ceratodon purpureus TaxID=3225 RepID=A0A8T0I5G5_CERPU|nr:hypothetical protein KC19_4G009600 [Ceratodon purpureus]